MNVSIRDRFANADDEARVEAAIATFAATHSLADADIIPIWADTAHPLFDELDSCMHAAATEGWSDPNGFSGEIILTL